MREGVWAAARPGGAAEIALQILREVPSFWVWDDVEQIGGRGAAFLADLLRDLGETRCKVLLVGRRPEEEWLGSLPCRIALPPMPMEERGELTIRIAARHGLALRELMSFAPLLRFSQGNPLTLSFLLSEALRQGCRQPEEVEAFLADLRLEEGSELAELSALRATSGPSGGRAAAARAAPPVPGPCGPERPLLDGASRGALVPAAGPRTWAAAPGPRCWTGRPRRAC